VIGGRRIQSVLRRSYVDVKLVQNAKNLHGKPLQEVLRSKGLKDATCVGWFGDDWDCSVGSPPEAMDHVNSAVPIGYAV